MLTAVVVAATLWRGQPFLPIVLIVAALRWPLPAVLGLIGWVVLQRDRRGRASSPDDEAAVLDRMVGELEGGASPRAALVAVGSRSTGLNHAARLASAGLDPGAVASALRVALPHNGPLVAAAWALAADVGAPAAPVMRLLARRASERGRLDRERRALTAQARATAWLIAGLPLAVCVVLALSGRLRPGPAFPVVLVGVLLQVIGLGIVLVMMRRTL